MSLFSRLKLVILIVGENLVYGLCVGTGEQTDSKCKWCHFCVEPQVKLAESHLDHK